MEKALILDKCRGSLAGGAVGDALGYAVEFLRLTDITSRYGPDGIADYELGAQSAALISDDTQMSLFTAEGLLSAIAAGGADIPAILPSITLAYEHWYYTQTRPALRMNRSWLTHLRALWARRAPGTTCLSALHALTRPGAGPVINHSKGCGGVMRVAPIGIYSAAHPSELNPQAAAQLAGYAADITHKHPLSTFSSMALALIVAECIGQPAVDRDRFRFIVMDRAFRLLELWHEGDKHLAELRALVQKALDLAISPVKDTDAIRQLGEGWVAEETLAIAVYSVMRHAYDFSNCVRCAVNHSGDSDSTGAVAGNIIGAILGLSSIPEKYLARIELRDVILSVADDLAGASAPEQISERYIHHRPHAVAPAALL